MYNGDGSLKSYTPQKEALNNVVGAGMSLLTGNPIRAITGLVSGISAVMRPQRQTEQARQELTAMADVVMFSGCKDTQTSADTFVGGVGATGAMSYAFMRALNELGHQPVSYLVLLARIRDILSQKYSQKPQLSTGRPMDMNAPFFM